MYNCSKAYKYKSFSGNSIKGIIALLVQMEFLLLLIYDDFNLEIINIYEYNCYYYISMNIYIKKKMYGCI